MSSEARYPQRLIEVDLPIKRISAHARREKSIRHGHISTLHIWWARRPLAACRAVVCAALWLDPADPLCPPSFRKAAANAIVGFAEQVAGQGKIRTPNLTATCSEESLSRWQHLAKGQSPLDVTDPEDLNILRFALLDFIADFANWDASKVPEYLETCRTITLAAHQALGGEVGTKPLVADPFAGGGSIPLEALRTGADAFASDLNPVAVLLNRVILEYIPKYGQDLADEVRKWGKWVKEEAEKELSTLYPKDEDGAVPVAYLWARTILSEAPGDGGPPVEVPLIRSMWLSKRAGRYRALRWARNRQGQIETSLLTVAYSNGNTLRVRRPHLEVFDPRALTEVESGTSKGGAATCPITGFTTSVESVRKQLGERAGGTADARQITVVTVSPNVPGRRYRPASDNDVQVAAKARELYTRKVLENESMHGFLPQGKLNHLRGFFNIVLYGMTDWGKLFNPRQALTLTTLARLVANMGQGGVGPANEMAPAVRTCLALAVSRHADINASLAMWHTTRELITHVFGRQALPMVWDFAEANSFGEASGSFIGGVDWIARVAENPVASSGVVQQASATAQALPDASVDAVVSDPPYYAAIPYADLSDFFYSWLRVTLQDIHPALFRDALSPKDEECVQLSHRAAMYRQKDAAWFEQMMAKALKECRRVNKSTGIGVFVFANKETSGWEAMLAALIASGWIVTASWPIDTEMGNRLRARNSAVLASSVHLVCRPRFSNETGDWRDVLNHLPKRIHEWMPRLASEGVVGADAIFACLGPALEIYSRYAKVEKASGEQVNLREYLEHVWAAVAKEALSMIFTGADATGFDPDARVTAIWLWTLNAGANGNMGEGGIDEDEPEGDDEDGSFKKGAPRGYVLEYDAARKIAQGLGARLEELSRVVEVKGDKARLLPVSERTGFLFGKQDQQARAKRPKGPKQRSLFEDDEETGTEQLPGELPPPEHGATVLDRLHQGMLLFARGRGEALKRFMVEEGVGRDVRFWRLAQALSALYPAGTEEKRWVDGVLARKKGLGF